MIFKSIRWRLQIWYGMILVAVLAGFGVTAYQLEIGRQYRNIDGQLQSRSAMLMSKLRQHAPRRDDAGSDFPNPPPGPDEFGPPRGGPPEELDEDRLPPPQKAFQLSAGQAALFGGDGPGAYYYAVWFRDGRLLTKSSNAPPDLSRPDKPPIGAGEAPRASGNRREVFHFTPPGECVLAGRSIAADISEMHRLAWVLAGVGGGILALGLAGGWWMVGRAMRPIADISEAATGIAAGDLARRIDVADTETELGRLATVLNSTFDRLEAAFAQQGRFTADAAHELRTPISVLLTQTQMALSRERSAPEYREAVESCHRAAQRMRRLIESMLELAKLDAGQERMKRMRFDLSAMVSDCVGEVRPLAEKRGINIRLKNPSVDYQGDSERLSQVMVNLLSNAIHYNRDNGEVDVTVAREDGVAVISVADTGPGMAKEHLSHIFERFYRVDQARTAAGRTGLGLAISKAIVDAHGGTIDVSSEPGRGAVFVVRLPLNQGPE